jgi:hypothetical protein
MEDVGVFYGHLVYFTAITYMYFMAIRCIIKLLGILFPFWYVVPRKSGNPAEADVYALSLKTAVEKLG